MRDLSEYYTTEYLTESTNLPGDTGENQTLQQHSDVDDVVEYDDLEFDLNDELSQETYYAGGDEGDSRNTGVKPKIKKSKNLKKESFQDLYKSIILQEMDEYDDFAGDDEGMEYDDADETIQVSASVIRDIISQLEGLVGGGEEEYDDEGFENEYDDDLEGDDFPQESWDGGAGDQRMKGDYSGKARGDGGSGPHLSDGKNSNKGGARVSAKPNNTEGSEGDGRLSGDYSGKARGDKGSSFTKGGNSNKGSAKVKARKTSNPEEDLFGV